MYPCQHCSRRFSRDYNRTRHVANKHPFSYVPPAADHGQGVGSALARSSDGSSASSSAASVDATEDGTFGFLADMSLETAASLDPLDTTVSSLFPVPIGESLDVPNIAPQDVLPTHSPPTSYSDVEEDWLEYARDNSMMSIDPSLLEFPTHESSPLSYCYGGDFDPDDIPNHSSPPVLSVDQPAPPLHSTADRIGFATDKHVSLYPHFVETLSSPTEDSDSTGEEDFTNEQWYQDRHNSTQLLSEGDHVEQPHCCNQIEEEYADQIEYFNQFDDNAPPDDESSTDALSAMSSIEDGFDDNPIDGEDENLCSSHWSQFRPSGGWNSTKHYIHPAEEHLIVILRKHRLKIGLYKEIMNWARLATRNTAVKPFDFDTTHTYKRTMKNMKLKYQKSSGGPPIKCLPFQLSPSLPPTYVYKFSLQEKVRRMLLNPALMEGFNLEFELDSTSGVRTYGEPNSATVWENHDRELKLSIASARAAGQSVPSGNHYIAMFQGFDDGTICDNVGRLHAQPYLATLLNFSPEVRRSEAAWFILGMIPPYPKTSAERKSDRSKVVTQQEYLEFYHKCLDLIVQELLELERRPYGVRFRLADGSLVNLHFRLSMIMGDTVGHDAMCGHFNCHSSNIKRMLRDCTVPQTAGDDVNHQCVFIKQEDVAKVVRSSIAAIGKRDKVKAARDAAKDLSQNLIEPVYWKFNYGGCPHGIFGILPYEMLHLFFLGLMKYLLFVTFEYVIVPIVMQTWYNDRTCHDGDGSFHENLQTRPGAVDGKKLRSVLDKSEFERRFRIINMAARRQSDRSMPKCPFKNGVTDLTRLTGQEYPGLCLIAAIALKGMYTWKVYDKEKRKYLEDKEKRIIHLLLLSLSMQEMLSQDSYDDTYLEMLKVRLQIYLKVFRKTVGPVRECFSKSGLRISKFHALLHFPFYILRYGSPYNFFGGFGESMMKVHLKEVAKNTSRRQDHLDKDVMHRHHEDHVCEEAIRELQKINHIPPLLSLPKSTDLAVETEEEITRPGLKSTHQARLHNPAFSAKLSDGSWMIHRGKERYTSPLYPDVQDFPLGDNWVKSILDDVVKKNADNKAQGELSEATGATLCYSEVQFSYACDFPSSSPGEHDTYRCHPDFHSFPHKRMPWHDWAMINWVDGNGDGYHNAAKVLLWAKLIDPSCPHLFLIVCAVQCLGSSKPQPDSHVMFAIGDKLELETKVRIVTPEEILSVAYVVPCYQHRNNPSKALFDNDPDLATRLFPNDGQVHKYFVVIPPRSDWTNPDLWNHRFSLDCDEPTAVFGSGDTVPPGTATTAAPESQSTPVQYV